MATVTESNTEKQVRLILERQCRQLAGLLKNEVPAGVGFILFLADFGDEGNMAYLSTIERESVFKLLHEWLDHQGANHPAEGWGQAAALLLEVMKASGYQGDPDPRLVIEHIRGLAK